MRDKTSGSEAVWQEEELSAAALPDKRLARRLRRLLDQMSAAPGKPVPAACGDWAATKAAYRFFDCEQASKIDPAEAKPIRRLRRRSAFGPGADSQSDRQNPMIARSGHVALILPLLSRPPVRLWSVGVYEYLGDHRWKAHGGRGVSRTLKIEEAI